MWNTKFLFNMKWKIALCPVEVVYVRGQMSKCRKIASYAKYVKCRKSNNWICTLPPNSLICMRPIRPLQLDCHHPGACHPSIGHRPKHDPKYCDYQLPDHLYISLRITSIKAAMPVLAKNSLTIMLSHYDMAAVVVSHFEFQEESQCVLHLAHRSSRPMWPSTSSDHQHHLHEEPKTQGR